MHNMNEPRKRGTREIGFTEGRKCDSIYTRYRDCQTRRDKIEW